MTIRKKEGLLRKSLLTGIISILLGILYYFIFHFSAQDSEQSGSLSRMVTEKCVAFMNVLSGAHWSDIKMAGLAEYFEHPVRKLAHFSEYACMGVLVYCLWNQWMRRGKALALLTVGWVFASAAADEFHQYFVPGRYASVADVLLDTCGGAFGVLCCVCVATLYQRRRRKTI
ncbi:VanZ family protein [Acetatifactor muris]|uniref:VanZ like family protein n=1 Tax=Acetatifactor muris TaxID=879566 RepID=A0A2K4ZGP3_9FIRM|nr:VanZ family protein [Acetatifactor muris]MCR2047824.1 VanZ family protein [Acetatifactor muris]SOY29627.1 VanZ like family protein [Acetatifactor muris]